MQVNHYEQAQTIFLTDVNLKNGADRNISFDNFTRAIALSCFRVLNFLSNSFDSDSNSKSKCKSNVKWGYKFFDSSKHVSKIENYVLRDFKTKYFEEFENELERRFEAIFDSKTKRSSFGNKPTTNKNKSADCLQRSLTEIIYDFQWENADLFSPVKTKNKKKAAHLKQTQNLVILFTSCPHNKDDLRSFCGKKVMDDDVFLDCIMPESLLVKFQSSKISLFWIDLYSLTNGPCCNTDTDISSLQLVDVALQKLYGKLIPVELILQLGHAFTSQITSVFTKNPKNISSDDSRATVTTATLLFPTNCSLDFYFSLEKSSGSCSHLLQYDIFHCRYLFGILQDTTKNTEICHLYLLPSIETSSVNRKKAKVGSGHKSLAVIPLSNSDSSSDSQSYSLEVSGNPHNLSQCDVLFSVYGTLNKATWKKHCIVHSPVSRNRFICHGYSLSTTKQDIDCEKGERSKTFEDLLREIERQHLVMVLRITQVETSFVVPCLAVLESFTAYSGIISILSLGMSLNVEKQLYSQSVSSSTVLETEECLQPPSSHIMKKLCSLKKLKENLNVIDSSGQQTKIQGRKFSSHVLEKNHLPGSSTMLNNLFTKLNNRAKDFSFLNDGEKKMLHKLQKFYRKENHPLTLSRVDSDEKNNSFEKNDTSVLDSSHTEEANAPKLSKRGSQSRLSRSQFLVSLGKEAAKEKAKIEETDNKNDGKKKDKVVTELINIDFNTEDDLKAYIAREYEKGLGDVELSHIVQSIYLLSEHYMKTAQKDNPQESAQEIIQTTLIQSNTELRDKYQLCNGDIEEKIQEYKLQILLRLELEATKSTILDQSVQECVVEEIVTMLRTLSFIKDTTFVPEFLKNVLVQNYIHTIPNTLVMIYNDLMLPLPDELESFLHSDESQDFDNAPSSNRSHAHGSVSSQPASNHSDILSSRSSHNLRNRKSLHHPSLTEIGHKRQIVVSNIPAKAKEDKSHKKKEKSIKKHKEKRKDEVKVRRNIFNVGEKTKLERRQSVAVMESTRRTPKKKSLKSPWKSSKHKSPWKSPRVRDRRKSPWKSPRLGKSPKAPKSPGRNSVLDTPAHKQFSNVLRDRVRKQLGDNPEINSTINVIEESPIKIQTSTVNTKNSPSEGTRVKALFRRAFYSAGPTNRSRNLSKSLQLADRIAGRHCHFSFETSFNSSLSQLDSSVDISSPSKDASSFLLSQFISSPSPTNKTPKKSNSLSSVPNTPVFESPSCNTRSKTPKKYITPKALFTKSPFVDNKMMKIIEERTPVKSVQKEALVSESPASNTRSKLMSPTRQSVRVALSFKSPSSKKISFDSPKGKKIGSIMDGVYNCGNVTPTKQCSVRMRTPQKFQQPSLCFINEASKTYSKGKNVSATETGKLSDMSTTPSPNKASKKIKTPESLDKWPRRKKRWNNEQSPHVSAPKATAGGGKKQNSDSDEEVTFKMVDEGKNVDSLLNQPAFVSPRFKQKLSQNTLNTMDPQAEKNLGSPKSQSQLSQSRREIGSFETFNNASPLKRRKSIKRSLLLSPDNVSNTSSPSKRLKTLKSLTNVSPIRRNLTLPLNSSQTVNTTGSVSSLPLDDYFSASNDEVFLSAQTSQDCEMDSDECTQDENNGHDNLQRENKVRSSINTHPKSGSPVFSPKRQIKRHKSFKSFNSSEMDVDGSSLGVQDFTTLSSPKSRRNLPLQQAILRNSPLRDSSKSAVSPHSVSPNEKVSPQSRKFSPNVSTKSLMHLMQSPLLDSAKKLGFQASQSEARKKNSKRSLNMI